MAKRSGTAIRVPEGYLVCDVILEQQEAAVIGQQWRDAVLRQKGIPILEKGIRFVAWTEAEAERLTARRYLERLQKLHHPHAELDPVGALGQVAMDLLQVLQLRSPTPGPEAVRIELLTGEAADQRDEVVLKVGEEKTVQVEVESEGIGQNVRVRLVGFEPAP